MEDATKDPPAAGNKNIIFASRSFSQTDWFLAQDVPATKIISRNVPNCRLKFDHGNARRYQCMVSVLVILLSSFYPCASFPLSFRSKKKEVPNHGLVLLRPALVAATPFYPTSRKSVLHQLHATENEAEDNGSTAATAPSLHPNGDDAPHEFSWQTIGRQARLFQQMALPYYQQESSTGRWLLAGVLGLTLLNSGVSVAFSYLGKDFWNALSSKDETEFYSILVKYVGALLVGAPVVTFYKYQREQLAVHWREWMTSRTFELYTSNRVFYKVERSIGVTDGKGQATTIDNPDQRISEDVNTFTNVSLQLVITLLTSVIDLASFSTILWGIYPQLFFAIILYAGIGTVLTAVFGKSLVGLNFSQLQREADLRYALVRLRENAESVAFYGGEDLEGQAIETRLEKVMGNQRSINTAQRNLELFTNSYRFLIQIVPVAVVAPKYFAGEIALGVISQSVGAFNHILSDLSIIVNQFERLSSFSAGIERLASFYEAMRDVDDSRTADSPLLQTSNLTLSESATSDSFSNGIATLTSVIHMEKFTNGATDGVILDIDELDLYTPDGNRKLIAGLNLTLKEGEHMLIVGNSGAGKSSLLRAIAGLWNTGKGKILKPDDGSIYFLPQRPYCTLGTLRDQLLYPSVESSLFDDHSDGQQISPRSHQLKHALSDDDLIGILEKVDLLQVATRAGKGDPKRGLNVTLDWTNRLSLGEQQRLAFGRILVNKPRLVILDEATSALDVVAEAKMYTLLKNLAQRERRGNSLTPPGLTFVSVGHRPSLLSYHDLRLRLSEDANELTRIDKVPMKFPFEVENM